MKNLFTCLLVAIAIMHVSFSFGQLQTKIVAGQLMINDGALTPRLQKYGPLADSLDKVLVKKADDSTSLFNRALLLDLFNNVFAKPAAIDKSAFVNLERARSLVERAIGLKMTDFRLKVLRAQVYRDLTYRYSGDATYMYNSQQIADRRAQFSSYQSLANKCYDELAAFDPKNANDFQKLKVKLNYPIQ